MFGTQNIFIDSGAAGAPPQSITLTKKCMKFFASSMILEHSITQTRKCMQFGNIFDDVGAVGAPPQNCPNQAMHRIPLHRRPPPQHYPNLERHGILSFSMTLEPPAPHHSTTQTWRCIEFCTISMILEPPAPNHRITQTWKSKDFIDFQ